MPVCGSEVDGVPACGIHADAGGVLPDLRRAVLTKQSGINSGVITLPFKHTLAKLKFEVVKQKTENGSAGVDVLAGIELKGISVSDYSEGSSCSRPENIAIREGKVTVRCSVAGSLKR